MIQTERIVRIDKKSKEYPLQLKEISDSPKQLYCLGNIELLNEKSVGIVGSRKYTLYGKSVSIMLGHFLAELEVPVVSGLALGIDGFAHRGMIELNGRGIGVLGSGINKMGPRRNYDLMMQIIKCGGLIVSEYEPDEPAHKYTFPRRNRIISGLSKLLIVVEANYNSGALITAQFANEQGRSVYAVPGNINSQFSMGSNLLIRDGAIPLVVFDDIKKELGIAKKYTGEKVLQCGEDEMEILNVLDNYNGIGVDRIAGILSKSVGEVNSLLTILEIKGFVQSNCGKFYKKFEKK